MRNRAGESVEFSVSDSPVCDNTVVFPVRRSEIRYFVSLIADKMASPIEVLRVNEDGEPWRQTTRTFAERATPATAMAPTTAKTQQPQDRHQ